MVFPQKHLKDFRFNLLKVIVKELKSIKNNVHVRKTSPERVSDKLIEIWLQLDLKPEPLSS